MRVDMSSFCINDADISSKRNCESLHLELRFKMRIRVFEIPIFHKQSYCML